MKKLTDAQMDAILREQKTSITIPEDIFKTAAEIASDQKDPVQAMAQAYMVQAHILDVLYHGEMACVPDAHYIKDIFGMSMMEAKALARIMDDGEEAAMAVRRRAVTSRNKKTRG